MVPSAGEVACGGTFAFWLLLFINFLPHVAAGSLSQRSGLAECGLQHLASPSVTRGSPGSCHSLRASGISDAAPLRGRMVAAPCTSCRRARERGTCADCTSRAGTGLGGGEGRGERDVMTRPVMGDLVCFAACSTRLCERVAGSSLRVLRAVEEASVAT